MIRFACTACGTELRAADETAGWAFNCPKCKQQLSVPRADLTPPQTRSMVVAAAKPVGPSVEVPPAGASSIPSSADPVADPSRPRSRLPSRRLQLAAALAIAIAGSCVAAYVLTSNPRPAEAPGARVAEDVPGAPVVVKAPPGPAKEEARPPILATPPAPPSTADLADRRFSRLVEEVERVNQVGGSSDGVEPKVVTTSLGDPDPGIASARAMIARRAGAILFFAQPNGRLLWFDEMRRTVDGKNFSLLYVFRYEAIYRRSTLLRDRHHDVALEFAFGPDGLLAVDIVRSTDVVLPKAFESESFMTRAVREKLLDHNSRPGTRSPAARPGRELLVKAAESRANSRDLLLLLLRLDDDDLFRIVGFAATATRLADDLAPRPGYPQPRLDFGAWISGAQSYLNAVRSRDPEKIALSLSRRASYDSGKLFTEQQELMLAGQKAELPDHEIDYLIAKSEGFAFVSPGPLFPLENLAKTKNSVGVIAYRQTRRNRYNQTFQMYREEGVWKVAEVSPPREYDKNPDDPEMRVRSIPVAQRSTPRPDFPTMPVPKEELKGTEAAPLGPGSHYDRKVDVKTLVGAVGDIRLDVRAWAPDDESIDINSFVVIRGVQAKGPTRIARLEVERLVAGRGVVREAFPAPRLRFLRLKSESYQFAFVAGRQEGGVATDDGLLITMGELESEAKKADPSALAGTLARAQKRTKDATRLYAERRIEARSKQSDRLDEIRPAAERRFDVAMHAGPVSFVNETDAPVLIQVVSLRDEAGEPARTLKIPAWLAGRINVLRLVHHAEVFVNLVRMIDGTIPPWVILVGPKSTVEYRHRGKPVVTSGLEYVAHNVHGSGPSRSREHDYFAKPFAVRVGPADVHEAIDYRLVSVETALDSVVDPDRGCRHEHAGSSGRTSIQECKNGCSSRRTRRGVLSGVVELYNGGARTLEATLDLQFVPNLTRENIGLVTPAPATARVILGPGGRTRLLIEAERRPSEDWDGVRLEILDRRQRER